jgi:hypothetical protein
VYFFERRQRVKKSLKKQEEKSGKSRSLALKRETILTLSGPLLKVALGGDGGGMPTSSGGETELGTQ